MSIFSEISSFGRQKLNIESQSSTFDSSLILDKLFKLSVTQFPHQQNGDNNSGKVARESRRDNRKNAQNNARHLGKTQLNI